MCEPSGLGGGGGCGCPEHGSGLTRFGALRAWDVGGCGGPEHGSGLTESGAIRARWQVGNAYFMLKV